jgi:hypothetical protein
MPKRVRSDYVPEPTPTKMTKARANRQTAFQRQIERAIVDAKILEMTVRGASTEEIREACGFGHRSTVIRRRNQALEQMTEEAMRRFEMQALEFTAALYEEGMRLLSPPDGLPPSPAAYTAAVQGHKRLTEFAGLGAAARVNVNVSGEVSQTVTHQVEHDLPELQGLLDQLVQAGYGSGRSPSEQFAALSAGTGSGGGDDDDDDDDDLDDADFDDDLDDVDAELVDDDPDDELPGRWVDGKFIAVWDELPDDQLPTSPWSTAVDEATDDES